MALPHIKCVYLLSADGNLVLHCSREKHFDEERGEGGWKGRRFCPSLRLHIEQVTAYAHLSCIFFLALQISQRFTMKYLRTQEQTTPDSKDQ